MECQSRRMELLPVHLKLLLLLSVLTFTYAQSDVFRSSPDKFTARSFPQPEPSSGSRVGRPSNRRNLFFPPSDRHSPTLRPILSPKDAPTTPGRAVPERATTPRSRFHPSGPSKFATSPKKVVEEEKEEFEEEFYEYYDDYYYDEPNATVISETTTQRSKSVPLSKSTKHNKSPTAFSKFHTGTFRFSAPRDPPSNRETIPRHSPPSRDSPQQITSTQSPFRFRFTTSSDRVEKTTKPATVPTTNTERKGLLADLIAQLKNQVNSNDSPSSNDVDSNRVPRILDNPEATIPFSFPAPKHSTNTGFRITNSTESTFSVGSVQSSHSIKGKGKKVINNSPPVPFFSATGATESQPPFEASVSRSEGKRVLEDEAPEENLTNNVFEPEGPPVTKSFSSLLQNIQIAVDPSLLPPGYSVEETITETSPEKELQPKESEALPPTSTPTVEPTISDILSKSTIEDIISSLPQEDITSLLPPGYISSSTEASFYSTNEHSNDSAPEDVEYFEYVEYVDSVLTDGSNSTNVEAEYHNTNDRFSSPPLNNKTTQETKVEEDELPSVIVSDVDISQFLPPGYNPNENEPEPPVPIIKTVDISKFLPPAYKPTEEEPEAPAVAPVVKTVDVSKFLPPGYKPTEEEPEAPVVGPIIKTVDVSQFIPPSYKPTEEEPETPVVGPIIKAVDVSKFLPPGYNPSEEEEPETPGLGPIIEAVDVSKFLPPGYNPSEVPPEEEEEELPGVVIKTVDLSAFLPPGYKPQEETEEEPLPGVPIKNVNIASFLPPGFSLDAKPEVPTTTEQASTTLRIGKSGIVFPRRPKRPKYRSTTTTTNRPQPSPPTLLKPKITNLFDRIKGLGATEYVVPVVTQSSRKVEAGQGSEGGAKEEVSTTTTSTTTTTTEPTTTTPPVPTTPGICGSQCRLAASLRFTSGTEWKPELANRDTIEFQRLSNEIGKELDAFFIGSSISLWYDFVEVDSFNRGSKGSVIVSYILVLSRIQADVDTKDLKERLNEDLERISLTIGNFTADPEGTDFIVIPEKQVYVPDDSENFLIPEWLIAVIVIGLASFLFILIFGVVALVSRAGLRKRANVPLTEEFLNNLNALQGNGMDNYAMNGLYDMDPAWNEKYPEKAMKPPSSRGKGYNPEYNVNIYDSWRTDYSGPYSTSSANQSKRRTDLDFEGKQFYKDDPYDF